MFLGEAISGYLTRYQNDEGKTLNSRVDENRNVHFDYKGNDYTFIPDFRMMTFKLHFIKDAIRLNENDLLPFINDVNIRAYYGKIVLDEDALDIVFEQDLAPCLGLDGRFEVNNALRSQSGAETFVGFIWGAIKCLSLIKDGIQEEFEKKFGKI